MHTTTVEVPDDLADARGISLATLAVLTDAQVFNQDKVHHSGAGVPVAAFNSGI